MHTIQRRRLLAAQLIRLPQRCDLSHQLLDGALFLLMGVIRPAHIALVIVSVYLIRVSMKRSSLARH